MQLYYKERSDLPWKEHSPCSLDEADYLFREGFWAVGLKRKPTNKRVNELYKGIKRYWLIGFFYPKDDHSLDRFGSWQPISYRIKPDGSITPALSRPTDYRNHLDRFRKAQTKVFGEPRQLIQVLREVNVPLVHSTWLNLESYCPKYIEFKAGDRAIEYLCEMEYFKKYGNDVSDFL